MSRDEVNLEYLVNKSVIASMHGFDFDRVLALTHRKQPPEVLVFGVEPATMECSLELSLEVNKVFPALLDRIKKEIGMVD